MAEILLSSGNYCMVDEADLELLSRHKWRETFKGGYTTYATRAVWSDGKVRQVSMHRQILGLTDPAVHVDHVNGDGLDNRRENLRICTVSQNMANARRRKVGKLGYRGVHAVKKYPGKYVARLSCEQRKYHSRTCHSIEEAAKAYDELAVLHHGEFAQLNFPRGIE